MNLTTGVPFGRQGMKIGRFASRKTLLLCGAASAVLYVAMDALCALLYDGYSYTDQTISELSAVGAPTRALWLPLGFLYSALVVAFGYGVWASALGKQRLRIIAAMIVIVGILGAVAWPFAPMHQREVLAAGGGTLSDTMHLVLGGIDSIVFIALIAIGAWVAGPRFRLYSLVTLAVLLVFGAFTGSQAPKVGNDEPTPWLGLAERVVVFAPMVWMGVLGITLWRFAESQADDNDHS